jgi:hypothetical protein
MSTDTVFTLTAKTYDAALLNLTTMTTDGAAWTLEQGYTGADWMHTNNSTMFNNLEACFRKQEGGRQINPTLYISGANATPVVGSTPARTNVFTRTAADQAVNSVSFVGSGGASVNVPLADMGNGVELSFPLTRKLQTFWWLGHTRNGIYTVTATMSDGGGGSPLSLVLPAGAFNIYQPNWFEVAFRGTYAQVEAGESINIRIARTGGASATSLLSWRAAVLLLPVAPTKPRGRPAGRR